MNAASKSLLKVTLFVAIMALCAMSAVLFNSCNVTRTVTTQSQYFTKGDTTCTIVTKTIETYDASKKGL